MVYSGTTQTNKPPLIAGSCWAAGMPLRAPRIRHPEPGHWARTRPSRDGEASWWPPCSVFLLQLGHLHLLVLWGLPHGHGVCWGLWRALMGARAGDRTGRLKGLPAILRSSLLGCFKGNIWAFLQVADPCQPEHLDQMGLGGIRLLWGSPAPPCSMFIRDTKNTPLSQSVAPRWDNQALHQAHLIGTAGLFICILC